MPTFVTPSRFSSLNDLDLVLRFAEPAAVIVEPDFAAQPRRSLGNWAQAHGFCFDALPLLRRILRRSPSAHYPQLRRDFVPLDHLENRARLLIQRARKPPRGKLNPMPLHRFHLGIECRDVLRTIIVGKALDSEPFQHFRAFFRAALLRVKRDDAPRHEVRLCEDILRRVGAVQQ